MLWDSYPTLVMEYGSAPGIYGDSCAETGRYFSLVKYLASQGISVANIPSSNQSLNNFRTDSGYIRHPLVPVTWRESDFSEDQWLPLFISTNESKVVINNTSYSFADEMYSRLKSNEFKTGNGNYIHIGTVATLMRYKGHANSFTDLFLLGGLLVTRFLPYSWNGKGFSKVDNSGDYLNMIHQVLFAETTNTSTVTMKVIKWVLKFCDLQGKVDDYYKNENPWIRTLYAQAFEKLIG